MSPEQQVLLEFCAPPPGVIIVNDRVCLRTEGSRRVVLVHGVIVAHYDISDRAAEEYAMLNLLGSEYADQKEIARAFVCSTRSIRRYEQRFEWGGLSALGRTPGRPSEIAPKEREGRDRTILRMKERGFSNRDIAQRLGLAENSVRKRLRRLGWRPQPEPCLPFVGKTDAAAPPAPAALSDEGVESSGAPAVISENVAAHEEIPASFDVNPLNRSLDRLLAAMGKLEDAAPLFAQTGNLPGAGVLLAIPALVDSGLLSVARKIYGSIGPAFYGLRTTLVTSVLLALLRIPRPETLKEYSPGDLGRIVGLDRMPEVKTLRRKLARLEKEGWTTAIREFRKRVKSDLVDWIRVGGILFEAVGGRTPEEIHDEGLKVLEEMHSLPVHHTEERAEFYREKILGNPALARLKEAFYTWCAVWFCPADRMDDAPIPSNFADPPENTRRILAEIQRDLRFLHWELEFPDVFARPGSGFDAVVGNPPWEIQKPNSREFFSNLDPLYRTYGKQEALQKQREMFSGSIEDERSWLLYTSRLKALSNYTKHAGSPFGDGASGGEKVYLGAGTTELHGTWRSRRTGRKGYADPAHPFLWQGSADINTYKMFLECAHALLRHDERLPPLPPASQVGSRRVPAGRVWPLDQG